MPSRLLHALSALVLTAGLVGPALAAENRKVERDGYMLVFKDKSRAADQKLADRLVETFFTVYPRLAADFNPAAPRKVEVLIDPRYHGIAATGRNRIRFNPEWFVRHPEDIDSLTHELMHVVQAYGECPTAPGWLTEGIADYARSKYGVDNAGAGWGLPMVGPGNQYSDGYRVTAAFLIWLDGHGHPGLVKALDSDLRACAYSGDDWVKLTGGSIETAWAGYRETGVAAYTIDRAPLTAERLEAMRQQVAKMEEAVKDGRSDAGITPQIVALAKALLAQQEARFASGNAAPDATRQ